MALLCAIGSVAVGLKVTLANPKGGVRDPSAPADTSGWSTTTPDFVESPAGLGPEFPVCTETHDQFGPAISGNYVVWNDYRNVNNDSYMKDLTTGVESSVCTETHSQFGPAISGNYVVWMDDRNWNSDIYMKNLSTGVESSVCTETHGQSAPAISGNYVVWMDDRNGNYDIYLKDLSTGFEYSVCTEPHNQCDPAISGNYVVWVDDRNGNSDIYMKDLSTGVESSVCTESHSQYDPDISGNYVVWDDHRNGNLDIYGRTILEAPLTAFTANRTSGTVPLTVHFFDLSTGSPTSWNWSFGDGTFSTNQEPVYVYTTCGHYTVSLTVWNAGGSNAIVKPDYINVTASAPTVTSIKPSKHRHGGKAFSVMVNGTGLQSSIPGTGVILWKTALTKNITASNVNVQSESGLMARLKIPKNTKTGAYNVTVINPDGQQGMRVKGFRVKT